MNHYSLDAHITLTKDSTYSSEKSLVYKLCTDGGLRCKQKIIALLTFPSAIEARNASKLIRFVMIITQANLFYTVIPV